MAKKAFSLVLSDLWTPLYIILGKHADFHLMIVCRNCFSDLKCFLIQYLWWETTVFLNIFHILTTLVDCLSICEMLWESTLEAFLTRKAMQLRINFVTFGIIYHVPLQQQTNIKQTSGISSMLLLCWNLPAPQRECVFPPLPLTSVLSNNACF